MRDLGYYSLAAMAAIHEKEAIFLTRLRYNTLLHDAEGVPLDLLKELRRRCSAGAPLVMDVQVGAKQKVPMRLIAVPLPSALADERRRRARKDRDARLHHSENYYALLSWTLLLTNLPTASLPAGKMQALYAMRWRIENIFRAWKGNLKPVVTSQHRSNEHHLRCLLHAQQILLAMAAQQMLMAVATGGSGAPDGKKKRPGKSLYKLMDLMLIVGGLVGVIKNLPHEHPVLQCLLDYHGRYDSRKRLTLPELIAQCLS
jgi:hypothetical protein